MNKFHKLAMLLASVALVLGLVACLNKTEPKPEPTPTPTPTPTGIPTASAADANGFVTISTGSMPLSSDGSYHVTITKAFMICDHEVTQAEWQDVMGNNPSYFSSNPATGENQNLRPVEQVNWYMAIAYCNKRSIKENLEPCYTVSSVSDWDALTFDEIPTTNDDNWNAATCDFSKTGYRLPTEAEWEIAARGSLTGDVYSGTANESELGTYAWYSANSDSKTHEVKKKSPNAYGLYDMSGNVWEWCWDWYDSYASEATDPTGPGSGSDRVSRGGSYWRLAVGCRASDRNRWYADSRDDRLGLRLVRSAQ